MLVELFRTLIHSGLEAFGRYYSSYRGFVVNREDPDGFGRVQLKVPNVYGNNTMKYWAWPKGIFSGTGYGMQISPKKGDMVWVEFEGGDPKFPIFSLGHFSRDSTTKEKEKPESLNDLDNYWFKTPGGHLVELDDSKKEIRITDIEGKQIIFNNTGISLIRGSKKISLGQLDGSQEPAVLGDKNKDALNALKGKIQGLANLIATQASADAAAATTYGFVGTVAQSAAIQAFLTGLNTLDVPFEQTKSTKVSLD